MARLWARLDRKLGLALIAVAAAALGGCGVDQKQYDALKAENEELRTKVTTAEASAKDNEQKLADANSRLAAQPQGTMGDGGGGGGGSKRAKPSGPETIEIAGDVLFDPGQSTIKSSAKKQLDKVASQLNGQYAGRDVRIEGYTDTDKPKKGHKSNQALSEARASAVRDYLVSKGVSSGRVSSVGKGDSNPKATKAASRRVDIVIL